jgi:hypothetical protein
MNQPKITLFENETPYGTIRGFTMEIHTDPDWRSKMASDPNYAESLFDKLGEFVEENL